MGIVFGFVVALLVFVLREFDDTLGNPGEGPTGWQTGSGFRPQWGKCAFEVAAAHPGDPEAEQLETEDVKEKDELRRWAETCLPKCSAPPPPAPVEAVQDPTELARKRRKLEMQALFHRRWCDWPFASRDQD